MLKESLFNLRIRMIEADRIRRGIREIKVEQDRNRFLYHAFIGRSRKAFLFKIRLLSGDKMNLKEIMEQEVFAVVGDTLNTSKYAYKIKNELMEHGYKVYSVGKELASINEIPEEVDVIDLCIHPAKGINLLKECKKDYKYILIQPGAESDEILNYLEKTHSPFLEGCALVGLRLYARKK